MGLSAFDTRIVRSETHLAGQLAECSGARGQRSTVLYAVPRTAAPPDARDSALTALVFPGDGVPCDTWHPLAAAPGRHPHSGGLLAVMLDHLHKHGGPHARASLVIVEPASTSADGYAVYSHLLGATTASGEPSRGYIGRGRPAATHLSAILANLATHLPSCGVDAAVVSEMLKGRILAFGFSKGGIVLNQARLAPILHPDVSTHVFPPMRSTPSFASFALLSLSLFPSSFTSIFSRASFHEQLLVELAASEGGDETSLEECERRTMPVGKSHHESHHQAQTMPVGKSHHESHQPAHDTQGATDLLRRLEAVHYLDAGLLSRGAHLTDPSVAAALGRLARRPRICFHGTPRQWRDPSRRWLVEEKDRSAALLREAGLEVRQREYLVGEPLSLQMHFGCVERFDLGLGDR